VYQPQGFVGQQRVRDGSDLLKPITTLVGAPGLAGVLAHFAVPNDGISFTQAGFSVLVAIVALAIAALMVLGVALVAEMRDRIGYLEHVLDRSINVAEQTVDTAREGLRSAVGPGT